MLSFRCAGQHGIKRIVSSGPKRRAIFIVDLDFHASDPSLVHVSYSSDMRTPLRLVTLLAALSFSVAMPLHSERMLQITGETLSGKRISFPSASAGSVAILCIGFSHASQSQLKPWAERATNEFRQRNRVVVYSIAVLEDAPRLVRGMAVHGMKSGVPAQQHDHFVVVYHGESELKQITGFQRREEAYILLLDPQGEIRWVGHGPVSDAALRELSEHVNSVLRSE